MIHPEPRLCSGSTVLPPSSASVIIPPGSISESVAKSGSCTCQYVMGSPRFAVQTRAVQLRTSGSAASTVLPAVYDPKGTAGNTLFSLMPCPQPACAAAAAVVALSLVEEATAVVETSRPRRGEAASATCGTRPPMPGTPTSAALVLRPLVATSLAARPPTRRVARPAALPPLCTTHIARKPMYT